MATNLHIDPKLLAQAVKAGNHVTKRDAVDSALREYVQYRKRLRVSELFGKIDYLPGQDPVTTRSASRKTAAKSSSAKA